MVGRERDPHIGKSDLVTEEIDEVGEFTIEIERHLLHFGRIGADAWPRMSLAERLTERKSVAGPRPRFS